MLISASAKGFAREATMPVKEKPKGLKKEFIGKEFVLAYGEVTGHKHLLTAEAVEVHKDATGVMYIFIGEKGKLTHEEHKQLDIIPGWYKVNNEREFNYWENSTQRVVD